MNFTLNQLRIFLKVAETGSVTKAAGLLHLTQPAVSIQLRNLQEQFDLPLTEVLGRKIYITDFGREIAKVASEILSQVATLDQKVMAHKGLLVGKIRLASVSTGKYVMPYFLSAFCQQHQAVEIAMDVTNNERVGRSLLANEIDFGLVSMLPKGLELEEFPLMENKLYLVGKELEHLPDGKKGLAKLTEKQLIFREKGSATRLFMDGYLREMGLEASKHLELTSNEAVKQAVMAGLGWSVMPLIGMRNELNAGQMHIIPAEGLPIETQWRLVWAKGKKHNAAVAAFLEHLQAEKEAIVKRCFG